MKNILQEWLINQLKYNNVYNLEEITESYNLVAYIIPKTICKIDYDNRRGNYSVSIFANLEVLEDAIGFRDKDYKEEEHEEEVSKLMNAIDETCRHAGNYEIVRVGSNDFKIIPNDNDPASLI